MWRSLRAIWVVSLKKKNKQTNTQNKTMKQISCHKITTGNLSSDALERRTSTGKELFSLLICLDATKFVLLSVWTLKKTIWFAQELTIIYPVLHGHGLDLCSLSRVSYRTALLLFATSKSMEKIRVHKNDNDLLTQWERCRPRQHHLN